ncbi:hypothetical protein LINPERPRIM_LOCUS26961, partial [Linum perenne]
MDNLNLEVKNNVIGGIDVGAVFKLDTTCRFPLFLSILVFYVWSQPTTRHLKPYHLQIS